ncbi:hypothetical protein CDD82_3686 [Ophiocordyceps australis]|uniref:NmrA-like domain-containing protein n=1 Tax=Ophiocordyceps australis TaxID=1399860 RepID=A0A2C5YG56_9HYPO|nr:hypothetical protein CDD82_3686 [Ophiocordyceps australis]
MKMVGGCLELLALLGFARHVVAAPNVIEYIQDMHIGQGVNTFTGELKQQNAVEVKWTPENLANIKLECNSKRISTYEDLAKTLDLPVAAAFGDGSFAASAKNRFIEEAKVMALEAIEAWRGDLMGVQLEETFITYVITCRNENGPGLPFSTELNWDPSVENPAEAYGDRFIRGVHAQS